MLRSRLLLLATATAVALLSATADAAPRPLLTDAKGDAKPVGAGYDIISATLTTSGLTKTVGKKKVFTPTALIASVTLDAPFSTIPGSKLTLSANTSACGRGTFQWSYAPGAQVFEESSLFITGCGEPLPGSTEPTGIFPATLSVKGNTVSWRLVLKDLGGDLPIGSTFFGLEVATDINDPVIASFGTNLSPALSIDTAASTASYTLR